MSTALEGLVRQTFCVISEGELCKKIIAPQQWLHSKIQSLDQLNACVDRAVAQGLRLLLVVGEDELSRSLQLVDLKKQNNPDFAFGVLLVSKEPKEFLRKQGLPLQVVDILSEKEAKSQLDYFLLKNIRPHGMANNAGNKIGAALLGKLNAIFTELSKEKNAEKLFEKIVRKTIEFGECSAVVLQILREQDGENYFTPKVSLELNSELIIDRTTNIVDENSLFGYVVQTGKMHTVFHFDKSRTSNRGDHNPVYDYSNLDSVDSIVTIPLKNSQGEIEGVLQVVFKSHESLSATKRKTHFDFEDETLWSTFANQVGSVLENVKFYADVQGLFEGFVRASVKAIEARDKSTGGHSERVAKMCVGLARAVTECEVGTYRLVKFRDEEIRELEYAAMLHDFGKIGVREEVLKKAKKLHGWQLTGIEERLKICKAAAKIHSLERKIRSGHMNDKIVDEDYEKRIKELENYWEIIRTSNSPTVLKRENLTALDRIRGEQLVLPDGEKIALLSNDEYEALSIMQGTLTEDERLEIESHVKHTFQFLKDIPWTREFKNLTDIAHCHHEKLDGTGYPRRLVSHEIPLQSKIMTIADIYDALTARDRVYKDMVPVEKALDILYEEVKAGKLDEALFELFVAKKIFEHAQLKVIHQVA